MNNNPLISIAMTTYNGEFFLEKQLDSIINQSYKNIEIIICDDKSSDKTLEILQAYVNKYSFIKLYKNSSNLGYVKNFEKAIKLCTADYIALSDQDDIWENNKLEKQLKIMIEEEKHSLDIPILIHSDLSIIDKDDRIINNSYLNFRKYKLKKDKDLGHIIGPCGVMGNTILFNKILKKNILPFPIYVENHDYWISLINEILGKRITLNNKLVKYRIHPTNTSNTEAKLSSKKTLFTLFKELFTNNNYPAYIKSHRFLLISYILKNFKISKDDKQILIKFQEYLSSETTTFTKIQNAFKYSFYKRDFKYKVYALSTLIRKKDISKKNFYTYNIFEIFSSKVFQGWGRKKTGKFALWCHKNFGGTLTLQEDGFIRSLGLGVDNSPSFSIVEDDTGIYYDAKTASKLENILNTYNFSSDKKLMNKAKEAISLIKKYHISKYNNSKDIAENYFLKDEKRVLIIAQTAGDSSLEYGNGNTFSTEEIISKACEENPDSKIYLKIHPDVLSGKKTSDINITNIDKKIVLISENINPISLLKNFHTVYTKTSQMGFEAILVGCKCVCFGMPFYAGWGITDDKIKEARRVKVRTIEEVFAASYILYSKYTNPYLKKEIDIIETINTIAKMKASNEKK
ncbi:glycosyltransferase [Poseidonibacter sp. 1_MG-2023]|uniref:capsular polysaccharide export protein, LipB/KpsS family n=1 Tax=Poseidonibacter TaxID=2321187 RepID=UPI001E3FA929|nr:MULTISPECIES: glycosyltransferase [Poseidonibacter]MDO6828654.1 glycosyltransferase [Poseidonibacter sp. 1_MG-2023]